MATNNTSSSNPRAEKMGDVLDALSNGIAKAAAREPKEAPNGLQIVRTTWNQFEIVLAGQHEQHHKPPEVLKS